jgi:hypothetical protein
MLLYGQKFRPVYTRFDMLLADFCKNILPDMADENMCEAFLRLNVKRSLQIRIDNIGNQMISESFFEHQFRHLFQDSWCKQL